MNPFFLVLFRECLAAAAGTAAFALLFSLERRHYLTCALVGAMGWAVDSLLRKFGCPPAMARLCASVSVAFVSRGLAVLQRCPAILLMIPGLFPLIPGGGIYWTVHHIVANDLALASETGFNALKLSVALVFGIVLVSELPQEFFSPEHRPG